MKRFLVVLQGDNDNYICSSVIAEIAKSGEGFIKGLLNKSSNNTGVVVPYKDSTLRYVYKIIYGDNRKDVLREDEMAVLYSASIQKYNELQDERV